MWSSGENSTLTMQGTQSQPLHVAVKTQHSQINKRFFLNGGNSQYFLITVIGKLPLEVVCAVLSRSVTSDSLPPHGV